MAAVFRSLAALWLAGLLVALLAIINTNASCYNCSKDFKSLYCPVITPDEERYTFKISSRKAADDHLLYQCHHTAQQMDFSFHKGCNFSSVKYVEFKRCPLYNDSFSKIFDQLGILPEKVLQLKFENIGTRKDLQIETWHLDGLTNLEILVLRYNLFTSLPSNMLNATPRLQTFHLSNNNISSLPETLFTNTRNISTINLLTNHFESLPDNLFFNISTLTTLRIYGNKIKEFSPNFFASIPKVYILELSINKITKLTSDTFKHLPNLQELYVRFNDLESLPGDIFHNCPKLQKVNLRNNKLLSLPAELFIKSKNITELNLRKNKISNIPQTLFQGLQNLTTLTMLENSLESIPDAAFTDLIKLKEMFLQNNPIKTLPPGTFDHQRKLETLNLANTSLADLPDNIFKNCESLETINLSDNHLSKLKSNFFPHPTTVLHSLNLGKNNLSFSAITSESQVQDVGEVQVEQFPLSDQVNLTALTLNNNKIKGIPHGLRNLRNLKKLDLKNNSIEYLDYYDFAHTPQQDIDIELRDNPLICDCSLFEFSQLLQGKISEEEKDKIQLRVVDKTKVKCSLPNDRSVQKLVMTLDTTKLICYRKECHSSCTCAVRPYDHMFIVECAHQGLHTIPAIKPYLPEGNYSIILDLKNNSITSLEGLQKPEYSNLVNLTMPYNYLKSVNESYLSKRLQVLDVSSNVLTHFSPSLIKFLNATNANLSLSGNPWLCDCQLVDLYNFLRDPIRKLASSHSIICDNFGKPLLSLSEEELCPTILQTKVVIIIACTTVFLFVLFVLGTVSVYKYQQNIKVWLFTHQMCLWAVTKEEADINKKYDAFISYANKDEDYVNNVLVPGLECGETKYRVCLHYRDWVPGDYIQNQIDQSIEDSHRTIVILSSNFIENVWGQIEFKTAHSKALKEKSKKIIVIVLGQVPPESEMDEELKLYLSTRTYLQSDHPRFWENLRYAMPHPQEFLQKRQIKTKKTERLQMVQTDTKARY